MNMARKHVKVEIAALVLLVRQAGPARVAGHAVGQRRRRQRGEQGQLPPRAARRSSTRCTITRRSSCGCRSTKAGASTTCAETVAWLEEYDPSRPVNEASGWHDRGTGTISDMHNYPGPGMRPVEDERVVVLGEFGGLGMPVAGPHLAGRSKLGLRLLRRRRRS